MVVAKLNGSITSREIAKLTGKRHDNVLRDIENMREGWESVSPLRFEERDYKLRGKNHSEFVLNKSQCLYVVSKYNDKIRALVINRLDSLELQLKERTESRLEHPAMTKAIEDNIKLQGKEPKFYNFSNEADMINRVVLGCSASQWRKSNDLSKDDNVRNTLTALQIQAVNHMQKNNTALIEMGFSFEDRKERLNALFNAKYSKGIINEFEILNA